MLAHLRLCLGATGDAAGRRKYPEPLHPYRNEFQRDRDRIIHSRAFRRLEGKTQVFAPGLSDHFRNRLTHTIEVAQIARTVACALELNEEFTETLALAHDIGHPPFAHAGERELNLQVQRFGFDFEHNLHSLRLVDHLERRYALFNGLNLTFEVREGIVKHSREIEAGTEGVLAEFLPGLKPPLEAQLLDIADEIAYNTADLDDAFTAGLIGLDEMADAAPFVSKRAEETRTMFPGADEKIRFNEIQRSVINALVGGFIEGTRNKAELEKVKTVEDVRCAERRLAALTDEAAALNRQLRTLLAAAVYDSEALTQHRKSAASKVGWLFNHFLDHPEHVSAGFRDSLDKEPLPRVVCDYIAGMTDGFFLKTYGQFAQ
jgi:dGTPase